MNNPCVGGTFIASYTNRVSLVEKLYNLYVKTDCLPERRVCARKLEKLGFHFPLYTESGVHMWDIMSFKKNE